MAVSMAPTYGVVACDLSSLASASAADWRTQYSVSCMAALSLGIARLAASVFSQWESILRSATEVRWPTRQLPVQKRHHQGLDGPRVADFTEGDRRRLPHVVVVVA